MEMKGTFLMIDWYVIKIISIALLGDLTGGAIAVYLEAKEDIMSFKCFSRLLSSY